MNLESSVTPVERTQKLVDGPVIIEIEFDTPETIASIESPPRTPETPAILELDTLPQSTNVVHIDTFVGSSTEFEAVEAKPLYVWSDAALAETVAPPAPSPLVDSAPGLQSQVHLWELAA